MKIDSDEYFIQGGSNFDGDCWLPDENSLRIAKLIKDRLSLVCRDASGWDALYFDPDNQAYWELIYPDSVQHGGGSPVLRRLADGEATAKYGKP